MLIFELKKDYRIKRKRGWKVKYVGRNYTLLMKGKQKHVINARLSQLK